MDSVFVDLILMSMGWSIESQAKPQVSNEPGLYFEGRFGIRIENLMLVIRKAGDCLQGQESWTASSRQWAPTVAVTWACARLLWCQSRRSEQVWLLKGFVMAMGERSC